MLHLFFLCNDGLTEQKAKTKKGKQFHVQNIYGFEFGSVNLTKINSFHHVR